jgi:DNA-binding transcriptional LysR family regulator
VNTQKLRVLFKAIELGSLTKAGEELGYSQSAITQMMKSLEEDVGFSLLSKNNRGVELTAEGAELIPLMRRIIDAEEAFYEEAAEICGMHKGTLWIGSYVSTSVHWLPVVLQYFQENYPSVKVNIDESGQDDLVSKLLDRRIDAALISDPGVRTLDFIPVYHDPLVVAYSDKYDLSRYDRISMDTIKDYPFLLTDQTYDRDVHKLISQSGHKPDIRYTSKDDYAVLSMVRHGLGITIIPELVVEGFDKDFSCRPYEPEYYRTLGVAVRSVEDASPLVRFFIKYIKDKFTSL